jgi:hypothetical protein
MRIVPAKLSALAPSPTWKQLLPGAAVSDGVPTLGIRWSPEIPQ